MTILFVGSTAADLGGNTLKKTSPDDLGYPADIFDSDFSSEAAGVMTTSLTTGNPFTIRTEAHTGDYWLRFRVVNRRVLEAAGQNGRWIVFLDANNEEVAEIDVSAAEFLARSLGDTTVAGSSFFVSSYSVNFFDIKINVGSDIDIEIYQNGVLASSATAANTGGKGSIRQAKFEHADMLQFQSSNQGWMYYSEVIVTDNESTIGMRVASLDPDTQGNSNDMSGDPSALLDLENGETIFSDTVGDKESWNLTSYNGPTSPTSIRAVVTQTRSTKGLTGPQNIRHFLRIGSTDYDNGSDLTPSPLGETHIWENNPATASAWSTSDFSSLQQGVEVRT